MASERLQTGSISVSRFGRILTPLGRPAPADVMKRLEVDDEAGQQTVNARLYPRLKRVLDFLGSGALLLLFSPVLAGVALYLGLTGNHRVLERIPRVGRGGRPFEECAFSRGGRMVRKMPILFNIVKGDMSFIGPRPSDPAEASCDDRFTRLAEEGLRARPGLVCDFWIRRHVSLDYVKELDLDLRYARTLSFRRDLGVVLRALPAALTLLVWGDDPPAYPEEVRLLGVRVNNISLDSAIDRLMDLLDGDRTSHVCFINPHNINQTFAAPEYRTVLDEADLVLADGFGTKLACKILRQPLRQNLCGTDLFPRLCERMSASGRGMYLLGSEPGVAERVADWVKEHYPNVDIKGCDHGYFTPEEEPEVVRRVAQSGADILVVGMGVPKQELWIHRNLAGLNVPLAMGFGGLFDYFSGRIPRAPQWVREIGMEWVYRLIQEPRRLWRRYLIGNIVFLARVYRFGAGGRPSSGSQCSTGGGPKSR